MVLQGLRLWLLTSFAQYLFILVKVIMYDITQLYWQQVISDMRILLPTNLPMIVLLYLWVRFIEQKFTKRRTYFTKVLVFPYYFLYYITFIFGFITIGAIVSENIEKTVLLLGYKWFFENAILILLPISFIGAVVYYILPFRLKEPLLQKNTSTVLDYFDD